MHIDASPLQAAWPHSQTAWDGSPTTNASHATLLASRSEHPAERSLAVDGFEVHRALLDAHELTILRDALIAERRDPHTWAKGRAVTSEPFYRAATNPRLLALLAPLLGEDIILWGASLVIKQPGEAHRLHTDVESSAPEGGFVSA